MFILKASECFLKIYERNLRAYEHFLRAYECICNVCDYRYISSLNLIRTHKAAMVFHINAVQTQHTWTLWASTVNKMKLHEVKLTTQNLSATLSKGFVKCNVNLFSVNKCIKIIFELT